MIITDKELSENPDMYLRLSGTRDILIAHNGKIIAKLTSSFKDRIDVVNELSGSVPSEMTLEEVRAERADRI